MFVNTPPNIKEGPIQYKPSNSYFPFQDHLHHGAEAHHDKPGGEAQGLRNR